MTKFDDKTLVAFVDGELDPSEAHEVQSALRQDLELRERVRVLRETASILCTAFAEVASEPIPFRLAQTVAKLAGDATQGRDQTIGSTRSGRRVWVHATSAAVIALVFGLAGGYVAADYRIHAEQSQKQSIAARGESGVTQLVQVTLEKKLSGTEASWRNPDTGEIVAVEPIRTFKNEEGRYCREYREAIAEQIGSKHVQYGMACRNNDGIWKVQYHLIPGEEPPALFRN
jgi:hypothetical protein